MQNVSIEISRYSCNDVECRTEANTEMTTNRAQAMNGDQRKNYPLPNQAWPQVETAGQRTIEGNVKEEKKNRRKRRKEGDDRTDKIIRKDRSKG